MDNFDKFTDDELEIKDILPSNNEPLVSETVSPDIVYETSLLGKPCTENQKKVAIGTGILCAGLTGLAVTYTMVSHHWSYTEGFNLLKNILGNIK